MTAIYIPIRASAWISHSKVFEDFDTQTCVVNRPNYEALSTFETVGSKVESSKTRNQDGVKTGIYLHWVIPRGFRHGIKSKLGPIEYPLAPNRWLITRRMIANGKLVPNVSWVVQSDVVIPRLDGISNDEDYATFCNQNPNLNNHSKAWIGVKVPLSEFKESDQPHIDLRISDTSNLLFADYQPHCQNVFSVFDPINPDLIPSASISYSIIGWYSNPDQDPIGSLENSESVKTAMSKLFLELPDDSVILPRAYTICHGTVYHIDWDIKTKPRSELKDLLSKNNHTSTIAVGANSVDALSALINSHDPSIPKEILEAFISGHLDKVDSSDTAIQTTDEVHKAKFSSSPGGSQWSLNSKDKSTLFPIQLGTLDKVNLQQEQYDRLIRHQKWTQWELFAAWWESNRLDDDLSSPKMQQITSSLANLPEAIDQMTKEADTLYKSIQTQIATTEAADPNVEFKQYEAERFWSRGDPTILVSNVGSAWPSDYLETLMCRNQKQLIIAPIPEDFDVTLGKQIERLPFPEAIQSLLAEFVILDPEARVKGLPISNEPKYGLSKWEQQPWFPLFVAWKIKWYQTPENKWDFKPRAGQRTPEYQFTGLDSGTYNPDSGYQQLSRISLILPQAGFSFKGRLKQMIKEDPEFTKIHDDPDARKQMLQLIDAWDILSHPLIGFKEIPLTRDSQLHCLPSGSDPVRSKIGDECHTIPICNRNDAFCSVSHGQFYFEDLCVIDRFGQKLDLMQVSGAKITDLVPVKSDLYTPDVPIDRSANQKFVQVRPTILQDARINGEWLTPDERNAPIRTNCSDNPICGWLIVNYLDRSFQVYETDGALIGELRLTTRVAGDTDPFDPIGSKIITNLWLQATIDRMKKPGVMKGFFEIMGNALHEVNVPPTKFSTYVSALLGRPIAIARARWGLELAQPAYKSHNYSNSDPFPLGEHTFKMKLGHYDLGHDGLIGYFFNTPSISEFKSDETTLGPFYTDYMSSGTTDSEYFKRIEGNYLQLKPFFIPIGKEQEYSSLQLLTTVLVDPFASIHGYTEIVPVYKLTLPPASVQSALQKMFAVFRTGPVLAPKLPDVQQPMMMPKPTTGKWTWLNPETSDSVQYEELGIVSSDTAARFEDEPYCVIEGLMKLNMGDVDHAVQSSFRN